jgi:hypothetical protein
MNMSASANQDPQAQGEIPRPAADPTRSVNPRPLSKSKLLAFRQCERRLWLEVHSPELRQDSSASQARFNAGHLVGELARQRYDPLGKGALIDPQTEGFQQAFARTRTLLSAHHPIFEAGFTAAGGLAFADVLLPVQVGEEPMWRMVEVKSSTSVKDYHRDDAAIQAHVARSSGVALAAIAVAHVDSTWVYPGGNDYVGLLKEQDVTAEAFARSAEVQRWIEDAQRVVKQAIQPERGTGDHCTSPFACGFIDHCKSGEAQAEVPVQWLPRAQSKALRSHVSQTDVIDMRQVPDDLLNETQRRVKAHTLAGSAWFDEAGASQALLSHQAPMNFLDFETIQFTVPIWAGTRPYQQIPFQFSMHRMLADGTLTHDEFLDLSGDDPSQSFADALIKTCDGIGPVFVYNAGFEKARMKELAVRFPERALQLQAIISRVVDLLPVARSHYYHPSQQGSWSIKKVLPAVVPELHYGALEGVQDGGAAMNVYLEAINPTTESERKGEIRRQLLAYCSLDTYAMVRLWQVFAGRQDLKL